VLLVKHMRPIFEFMGMSLSDVEIRAVMAHLDLDGNKIVDEEDFWHAMLIGCDSKVEPGPSFDTPFDMFDHDGDGVVGQADYEKSNELLGKIFCAGNRAEWNQVLNAAALEQRRNPDPEPEPEAPSSATPSPSQMNPSDIKLKEKKSAFTDYSRVEVNENGEVVKKEEEDHITNKDMVLTKHMFSRIVSGKLCTVEGAQ
jgi:hypothetical protein